MPQKTVLSITAKGLFISSAAVLIFLAGSFLAINGIHPFNLLEKGLGSTVLVIKQISTPRFEMLKPKVYQESGLTHFQSEKSYPGLTAIQGWFTDGAQVKLLDHHGNTLHQWPIDFFKIWPEPQHIYPEKNIPKGKYNFHSQGFHLLEDGSLIANISNMGSFKMDKCGEVLWTFDSYGHHSITIDNISDAKGSFWIPDQRDAREIPEHLRFRWINDESLLRADVVEYENLLSHVDKNGKLIKQFSVLQALVDAGLGDQLHDALQIDHYDPTHLNDIEIVNEALAQKIPGVNRGDLLISLRNLHMLAILDAESGALKWQQRGPWVRQHDPDISEEGTIIVFNNRALRINLGENTGSHILEFDPAIGQSRIRYPVASDSNSFYTDIMGTQQLLPNSNLLLAESRTGRAFEVTPEGEIVWQYIEAYDEVFAALFTAVERFPEDYFSVTDWHCPSDK